MDIVKPNSANIQVIEWKNKFGEIEVFRLVSSIMHRWREVGNLVVVRQQLEVWSRNNGMDEKERCYTMLCYWLQHPPLRYPVTWEGLYKLLNICELGEIARELECAVKNAI